MEKASDDQGQNTVLNTNAISPNKGLLSNQDAFNIICQYLDLPEIVALLQASKTAFLMTNSFIKFFLFKHKMIDEINPTFPIEYYYKIWRAYFCRDLNAARIPDGNLIRPLSMNEFTCFSRFSTLGIKDFSTGTKFTAFHLYNGSMVFLKTDEYLNPIFDPAALWRKNTRQNVKKFYTGAKNLLYVTESGQLFVVFYAAEIPSSQLSESMLEVTLSKPLLLWSASYNHVILGYNENIAIAFQSKPGEIEEEEKMLINDLQSKNSVKYIKKRIVQSLSLLDLNPQDLNAKIRLTEIAGLEDIEITDICVGSSLAYFLDDKCTVYECDFSVLNNQKYKAFPYEPLKKKTIRKIFSGWSYYFAVEKEFFKGISSWSNEEVLSWAEKVGFQDYTKILKHEQVTGETLASAGKRYLIDTLGVTRDDLQNKFLYEISCVAEDHYLPQRLYGWGNNNAGQLALLTGNLTVKIPQEVALPPLYEKEEILKLECGFKCSLLLTTIGRLFISYPIEQKTKQSSKEIFEESKGKEEKVRKKEKGAKKEEKGAKKNKSDKKKDKQNFGDDEKPKEKIKEHRWDDISVLSTNLRDKRMYKIVNASLNKDYLLVLGAFMGYWKKGEDPHQILLKHETSGQKLTGSDHIIHRILWDKSYDSADFTIGYEDRFLGTLELPFSEFIASEIPQHRIRFFKKKGVIMWDRAKRINHF